ncbi:MAG TPA: hypothetical protein PKW44_08210, partial [Methylophilaceae bacterium]|nr:hypothetical protein [Methylophilaceae bacterium]
MSNVIALKLTETNETQPVAKPEAVPSPATGYRRAVAPEWLVTGLQRGIPMLVGVALFIALWALISQQSHNLPGP